MGILIDSCSSDKFEPASMLRLSSLSFLLLSSQPGYHSSIFSARFIKLFFIFLMVFTKMHMTALRSDEPLTGMELLEWAWRNQIPCAKLPLPRSAEARSAWPCFAAKIKAFSPVMSVAAFGSAL